MWHITQRMSIYKQLTYNNLPFTTPNTKLPSEASDYCLLFYVCCMTVAYYCTFITQIYDHNLTIKVPTVLTWYGIPTTLAYPALHAFILHMTYWVCGCWNSPDQVYQRGFPEITSCRLTTLVHADPQTNSNCHKWKHFLHLPWAKQDWAEAPCMWGRTLH